MGNFYKRYYYEKESGEYPPHFQIRLKSMSKDISDDTIRYYQDLADFFMKNEIDITFLPRPLSKRNFSSTINAMKTLLRKNGLLDEFYKNKERNER